MAVDHDEELDLEELDIEEIGSGQPRGGVLSDDDLEQYGVWVKVKPHAVGEKLEPDSQQPDVEGLEVELPSGEAGLTEEEEQLLGSLEESTSAQSLPELEDLGELTSLEEPEPGALEPDTEHVELELSEEPASKGQFDDLDSLEEEIATAPASGAEDAQRSQVLQKIEEELTAIRGELAALKSELVSLRRPATEVEVKPVEAEREAGFFSDDSDETIALTGDELDNILNTAEITEEEASELNVGDEAPEIAAEAVEAAVEETLEPLEAFSLDEPTDETLSLDSHQVALEIPTEAESAEESIDLDLPDVEEIGLDSLEALPESVEEEPAAQPLEELEIDLADESLGEEKPQPTAAARARGPAEKAAKAPQPQAEAAADDELLLEVPEEVSEDLEPLEALEELEAEAGAAAEPEEIALDVPELEMPDDEHAGLEDLALEVPAAELAEAEEPSLESEEPAEAAEAEALEEIEAVAEPLEEVEELTIEEAEAAPAASAPPAASAGPRTPARPAPAPTSGEPIPGGLKDEIRTVLKYMDQLLEALPDDKIEEFANSEYFEVYRRLFEELEIA